MKKVIEKTFYFPLNCSNVNKHLCRLIYNMLPKICSTKIFC